VGATIEVECPVEGCEFTGHFRVGMGAELTGDARAECVASLHIEHPNHPVSNADREPLEAFADDSVEPDLHLNEGQREALRRYIAQREGKGYSGSIGLANIGAGYVKVLFYDVDGNVVDKQLLFPLYGDAVMPDDPSA
jgi:hypothetical protein